MEERSEGMKWRRGERRNRGEKKGGVEEWGEKCGGEERGKVEEWREKKSGGEESGEMRSEGEEWRRGER